MKQRLTHIAPLRFGIVVAAIYALFSLILVPFFLLVTFAGVQGGTGGAAAGRLVFILLLPVLYTAIGFIGGVLIAAIYNFTTPWTGGIEFTTAPVAPVVV